MTSTSFLTFLRWIFNHLSQCLNESSIIKCHLFGQDEFESEKTGAQIPSRRSFGRGLLEPLPEERVDPRSERYFNRFRYSRAAAPAAYSSVDLGLVSPVKNQVILEPFTLFREGPSTPSPVKSLQISNILTMCPRQKQCGSCVAFSNMALVETCFKKVTGVFGDYAEQQFVDCGYMFHVPLTI